MKTMTNENVGAKGSSAAVHALEQRLARVERSNRRLLRACGAGALLSAALLIMGQAPVVTVPDVIAAKSFRLVDAGGRVRGVWEAGEGEDFALVVYDASGKKASTLRLSVADPYLALSDASGAEHEGNHLFSWGGVQQNDDGDGGKKEHAEKKGEGGKDWPSWGGDPDEDEPFSWDD
jgi:hypothetical protein